MLVSECYSYEKLQYEAGIEKFSDHSLDQASKLSLMNRFDTKYLLPLHLLPLLLHKMEQEYTALQINNKKLHEYETQYFDTPSFKFYLQHHNRKLNRPKVRIRNYTQSNATFLEVKFKNNKKRTEKNRLRLSCKSEFYQRCNQQFLSSFLDTQTIGELIQVLTVQYSRMSFMSMRYGERVSVDIGLRAHCRDGATAYELRDYAIVEVKQPRISRESPIFKAMKECSCRPVSFSKYCISCALLFPESIRTNRFKWILNRLSQNITITKRGKCA